MAQAVSDPEREVFDYPDPIRPRHSMLRFLAPLAIIAFAAAILIAVKHNRHDAHHGATATQVAAIVAPKLGPHQAKHGFWIVRKDQTLSYIATREKTTVSTLLALNKGLNADNVHPGEHVRVR